MPSLKDSESIDQPVFRHCVAYVSGDVVVSIQLEAAESLCIESESWFYADSGLVGDEPLRAALKRIKLLRLQL